jgi:hypothetical protein
MTTQAIEGACAFAWRNYMLLHSGISEDDNRRAALSCYITSLGETGEYDFGLLQVAAVAYLKNLDRLHEDGDARRAADQALVKCLEARNAQSTTADRKGKQYDQQDF